MDIAKKLNISVGTVKWHLSDIRSGLKEKIDMVKNSNLSVNPIYFINMGHSGSPGKTVIQRICLIQGLNRILHGVVIIRQRQ